MKCRCGCFCFSSFPIKHNATISFTLKVLLTSNQHAVETIPQKEVCKRSTECGSVWACLESLVSCLEPLLLVRSPTESFCSGFCICFLPLCFRPPPFRLATHRHHFDVRSICSGKLWRPIRSILPYHLIRATRRIIKQIYPN